jgi:uncharacterized protein
MDVLIGFVIAVVIALSGVGAGVITAPLLIIFMHVPIEIAVSTALAYSAVVKLIVVPVQIWRRQVVYRVLGYMLLGGLPGVVIGSLLFKRVAQHGPRSVLYAVLGSIIIFSAGWHIYRHFVPAGSQPQDEVLRIKGRVNCGASLGAASKARGQSASARSPENGKDRPKWISVIMLPIGAEVGFSSSGAGALGTIALLSLTSLTASQVVGTDLTFGLGIALAGTGVHAIGGVYNTALLWKLALGGVFGGILGSTAAPRIPNRQLRLALSVWLFAIGLEFCYQALHLATSAASLGNLTSFLR